LAEVLGREGDLWVLRLGTTRGDVDAALERQGCVPLPPYIRRENSMPTDEDRARYQTVYARRPGSVAAPTAGLHFTPELLAALAAGGIRTAALTLHVGPATFQPVRTAEVEAHRLAGERYELPAGVADAVATTRREQGRVIAVGTTVVRVLESGVSAGAGECTLFIYPGHAFRVVDGLLTNFHLPRSTLLMLVAAFAGRERVLAAYQTAVREGYRFYSYGDAMLVV
jgi:S-adenosylmethionine:tRNA ribosyltransferase-isomerase